MYHCGSASLLLYFSASLLLCSSVSLEQLAFRSAFLLERMERYRKGEAAPPYWRSVEKSEPRRVDVATAISDDGDDARLSAARRPCALGIWLALLWPEPWQHSDDQPPSGAAQATRGMLR